mgnify:CR=1 FL=1
MKIKMEDFKYSDFSNNLFTKITLVNTLDLKEIELLNEKYHELGLCIKQVRVDKYGNEKSPNELLYDENDNDSDNLLKRKRKRHSNLYLEKLFNMDYDSLYEENEKAIKKLIKSKCKDNKNQNNNNRINNNNDDNQSEDENEDEDEGENINEVIKSYRDFLIIKQRECQNVEYKNCKIEDENFKKKIIEYIKKFSKFISDDEYRKLFIKWRDENMKIKGMNLFDCDDLYKWKLPILKAFKSEISHLSVIKTFSKKIDRDELEKNDDEEEEDKKKEDKKKVIKDDSSSSNSEDDDDDFLANQAQINQLNRNARANDEE